MKKIFSDPASHVPAWLPGVLTLLLLLPGITLPFWDRDEAEYAAVARDMEQPGHFFKPELFGKPFAEKPPLAVALTTISFRWLGEHELAGRLPHVLLFSASAIALFLIGRRIFDTRRAFFAALMLPTSLLGVLCGRLFLTDSALLFFSLAAVLFFLDVLGGTHDVRAACLAGVAVGLGILTKGPVAALVPGLFAIGYSVGSGRLDHRARRRLLLVAAVAVATSVPWFLVESLETHGKALRSFWLRDNLGRFLQPLEGHGGPILYYVPVLLLGFFPWSGLLTGVLDRRSYARDPVGWGLWAWGGGVLLFFSLSATKLPSYLLPALPAFALLIVRAPRFPDSVGSRVSQWLTAGAGAVLLLAAVIAASRLRMAINIMKVFCPFAAATLPFLALPLFPSRENLPVRMLLLSLASAAVMSIFLPPKVDGARCWARLGRRARIEGLVPESVGTVRRAEPALRYYVGERGTEIWRSREEMIRKALARPDRSLLACLTATDALATARDRRVRLQILAWGFNAIEDGPRETIELCRLTAHRLSGRDTRTRGRGRRSVPPVSGCRTSSGRALPEACSDRRRAALRSRGSLPSSGAK